MDPAWGIALAGTAIVIWGGLQKPIQNKGLPEVQQKIDRVLHVIMFLLFIIIALGTCVFWIFYIRQWFE